MNLAVVNEAVTEMNGVEHQFTKPLNMERYFFKTATSFRSPPRILWAIKAASA